MIPAGCLALGPLCLPHSRALVFGWIPATEMDTRCFSVDCESSFLQPMPHTCSRVPWFPNTCLFLLSRRARTEFKECLHLYRCTVGKLLYRCTVQYIWRSRTFYFSPADQLCSTAKLNHCLKVICSSCRYSTQCFACVCHVTLPGSGVLVFFLPRRLNTSQKDIWGKWRHL